MALFTRKPKKTIRITRAAKLIGCSSESIRTGAVGDFRLFKLNPDKATSPVMMFEEELHAYLEKREANLRG
jgi:hypothetical protein